MIRKLVFPCACLVGATLPRAQSPIDNSVVVIVMDDIGIEWLGSYADLTGGALPPTGSYPETPNIDAIMAQGVRFKHAWATSLCSSTRAMMNTGSYPFRTGIGRALVPLTSTGGDPTTIWPRNLLAPNVPLTLGLVAQDAGYVAGAFGKWHMTGSEEWGLQGSPAFQLVDQKIVSSHVGGYGFDRYFGHLFQPNALKLWEGFDANGFQTVAASFPNYLLCDISTNLTAWVQTRTTPFLCWFAPLAPYELLYQVPNLGEFGNNCFSFHNEVFNPSTPGGAVNTAQKPKAYHALVETTDTLIGKLLSDLDAKVGGNWYDEVTIILIGDNGTPEGANFYWPDGQTKGQVWEGGIRVPFVIAGKAAVSQRATSTSIPVTGADVYLTVDAIMQAHTTRGFPDGVNLLPILQGQPFTRSSTWGNKIYSERFAPDFAPPVQNVLSGSSFWVRTATDGTYKVTQTGTRVALYEPPLPGYAWTFSTQYSVLTDPAVSGSLIEAVIDGPLPEHAALRAFMNDLTGVVW